jgi:hypothetical protein
MPIVNVTVIYVRVYHSILVCPLLHNKRKVRIPDIIHQLQVSDTVCHSTDFCYSVHQRRFVLVTGSSQTVNIF